MKRVARIMELRLQGIFILFFNYGALGLFFNRFCIEHGLDICNASGFDDAEENYICRSCLGMKRRIDFIAISQVLRFLWILTGNEIDLGSDHRAVQAEFEFCRPQLRQKKQKSNSKGWTAKLDEYRKLADYQRKFDE